MTIQLNREQIKMLSPKVKKEIAFENKWRNSHTVFLFVREPGETQWSKLRSLTWATETEHRKVRLEIERQLQGWRQTVYPNAQFKIIDNSQEGDETRH